MLEYKPWTTIDRVRRAHNKVQATDRFERNRPCIWRIDIMGEGGGLRVGVTPQIQMKRKLKLMTNLKN